MKLLLTSGGLANKSIIQSLTDLLNKPFNETHLAFIPTAANLEDGDKWWLINDLKICSDLKFKTIDMVDFSALPKEVWLKRLMASDVLFVEGGNTFHLNYWVNKSGFKDVLPELLKSKVYVGVSAGTIVVTPSLVLSLAEKQPLLDINETIYDEGLKLVDFLVEPHLYNSYFPKLTFEYVEKQVKNIPFSVYALDDNSAIKVDDDKIDVVSEGKWKKFN